MTKWCLCSPLFAVCFTKWPPVRLPRQQKGTLPRLCSIYSFVMAFAARPDWFISNSSFTLEPPIPYLMWGASSGEMPGTWEPLTAELAVGVTGSLQECWKHAWNALPLPGLMHWIGDREDKIAISFWQQDVFDILHIPVVLYNILDCLCGFYQRIQSCQDMDHELY